MLLPKLTSFFVLAMVLAGCPGPGLPQDPDLNPEPDPKGARLIFRVNLGWRCHPGASVDVPIVTYCAYTPAEATEGVAEFYRDQAPEGCNRIAVVGATGENCR